MKKKPSSPAEFRPHTQQPLHLLFIFFVFFTTTTHAQPDCATFSASCAACTANDHCVYCNQTSPTAAPSKCIAYLGTTSLCASPVLYNLDCRPCDSRLSCADCLTSVSPSSAPSNAAQCSWCSSASAAADGGLCVAARASCNRSPFFLRTDQFASCARFVTTVPIVSSTLVDDSAIDLVSTASPAPSPPSLVDQPAIIGASVAALVLIVLIVVLAIYLVVRFRRLRVTQSQRANNKSSRPTDDSLAVRNAAYDSDFQVDHRGGPVRVISARRIDPMPYDNPFSTSKHIEQAPRSDRLFSPPLHMTTNILPSPYSFERRLPNGEAMYDAVPPEDDF
jgi:hypothetical protein